MQDREDSIGKNPYSEDLSKILSLSPQTAYVGLGILIEEYRQVLGQVEDFTDEEHWQASTYEAVNFFLDSEVLEHPDYNPTVGDLRYKNTIKKAVGLVRFIGFSDRDLSADGIVAAGDRGGRLALRPDLAVSNTEEDILIEEDYEIDSARTEGSWPRPVDRLRQRLYSLSGRVFGEDKDISQDEIDREEDMFLLEVLEGLRTMYDKIPRFEELMADKEKLEKLSTILAKLHEEQNGDSSSPI